ncbi:hypothetical protein QMK50_23620 [Pseudomonas sp. P5_152]|uniref:hypothetical protein n=1 Tax=Pseudomonas sp. P5_152 TaxID=3043442 RepID=UPI002A36F112|nr:hypothetical protein [Pseudomonas sp. P5_152]MDX9667946.1 hypothetical protein [Pseudomonas sp. P5_152]
MERNIKLMFGALKNFWFFSSAFILAAFICAIFIYRSKFNGALSDQSADWSNFGSFMGGMFGPLISFITLLAVLKTVYLQRELMRDQRNQFSIMNKLQEATFDAQSEQLKCAAVDAERMKVADLKRTLLSFLNQRIESETRGLETFKAIIEQICRQDSEITTLQDFSLSHAINSTDVLSRKIDALLNLGSEIVTEDFNTEETLRGHFKLKFIEVQQGHRLSTEIIG